MVFAFHSWEFAGHPYVPILSSVVSQNTRPDLFIVLTGFVLFLPFARDPGRVHAFRTGPYLMRRLRRIVPPYYAALAIALAFPYVLVLLARMAGLNAATPSGPDVGDVVTHLTFTHLFFPEYWAGINGSLWTMSLEMQFYLIFPLLILLVARFGLRALILAVALALAYRVGVAGLQDLPVFHDQFLWSVTGIGRLMQFAAGMLAAVLALRWRGTVTWRLGVPLAVTAIGGYVVATRDLAPGLSLLPIRDTALALAFGALIVLVVTAPPMERVFAAKPLARLGYMAYSMFLVHQVVVYYFSELLQRGLGIPDGHLALVLLWTVGLAVVGVFGYGLHVAVEKPSISWSRAAGDAEEARRASSPVDPSPVP